MPPEPAGGLPKPLSAGGTAAAPKQDPHTGGWSISCWGAPDKVRVGRSPLVSQQDGGGEQGGQEGTSLTPGCPSAAHPGGQEADLGGHGQHRGVPAGVPLLHRGHGRAQQLLAVSSGGALGVASHKRGFQHPWGVTRVCVECSVWWPGPGWAPAGRVRVRVQQCPCRGCPHPGCCRCSREGAVPAQGWGGFMAAGAAVVCSCRRMHGLLQH